MRYPDQKLDWPICYEAVRLIAEREQGPRGGAAIKAYRCPAGIWTIAWGRTAGVVRGMTCTQDQADMWLLDELNTRSAAVRALCTVEPSAAQLGALVSLQYNIGAEALKRSTVLKRHNAGDVDAAARAFALWNKARVNGKLTVLPGLTERRAAESALYLRTDPDDLPHPMPQAVAPESSLAASPLARIGAGAAGTGVLTTLSDAGTHMGAVGGVLSQAREIVLNTLGLPPGMLIPALLVGGGAAVVWWRWKQRHEGWA